MKGGEAFGPWLRGATAALLGASALAIGIGFFAQFGTVFSGRVEDVLMGPSLDEGLQKREKWVHLVRAAAAMNTHCNAVLERARAGIEEFEKLKRPSRAARSALRTKLAKLADDVRPCESAELFLKLAGKERTFPHVAGLSRYLARGAKSLTDAQAPRDLGELRVAWRQPSSSQPETRSVLGVVVRGPTWYVETDPKLVFRGSTAQAWEWLSAARARR